MIPLIKNSRGNKQSSDNYRSLTIGTGLAKLLDIVILNQQSEKLKTCDQQFGFKEKSSTTMYTFMALKTIEHYKPDKNCSCLYPNRVCASFREHRCEGFSLLYVI